MSCENELEYFIIDSSSYSCIQCRWLRERYKIEICGNFYAKRIHQTTVMKAWHVFLTKGIIFEGSIETVPFFNKYCKCLMYLYYQKWQCYMFIQKLAKPISIFVFSSYTGHLMSWQIHISSCVILCNASFPERALLIMSTRGKRGGKVNLLSIFRPTEAYRAGGFKFVV